MTSTCNFWNMFQIDQRNGTASFVRFAWIYVSWLRKKHGETSVRPLTSARAISEWSLIIDSLSCNEARVLSTSSGHTNNDLQIAGKTDPSPLPRSNSLQGFEAQQSVLKRRFTYITSVKYFCTSFPSLHLWDAVLTSTQHTLEVNKFSYRVTLC